MTINEFRLIPSAQLCYPAINLSVPTLSQSYFMPKCIETSEGED
jgi:hypothetical protein